MRRPIVVLLLLIANAVVSSGGIESPAIHKSLDFFRSVKAAIVRSVSTMDARKVTQVATFPSRGTSTRETCARL